MLGGDDHLCESGEAGRGRGRETESQIWEIKCIWWKETNHRSVAEVKTVVSEAIGMESNLISTGAAETQKYTTLFPPKLLISKAPVYGNSKAQG